MKKLILIGILAMTSAFVSVTAKAQQMHHWEAGTVEEQHADPIKKSQTDIQPFESPSPAGDFSELRQTDSPVVEQVLDPYRLRLQDKRIVQLTGIDVPDFNLQEPGDLSLKAQDLLKSLIEGKQVTLYQTRDAGKGRVNRLGYMLAQVTTADDRKIWLQGKLLAGGLARVQPGERNPEMADQMIRIEDQARQAGNGLWALDKYKVLTPEAAADAPEDWAIVEGKVSGVAAVGNLVYVNFGPDWKTDFTIGIDSNVRRQMAHAGINPLELGGKTVRVRGWIKDYNGPYIELLNPVWLEVLHGGPAESKVGNNQNLKKLRIEVPYKEKQTNAPSADTSESAPEDEDSSAQEEQPSSGPPPVRPVPGN